MECVVERNVVDGVARAEGRLPERRLALLLLLSVLHHCDQQRVQQRVQTVRQLRGRHRRRSRCPRAELELKHHAAVEWHRHAEEIHTRNQGPVQGHGCGIHWISHHVRRFVPEPSLLKVPMVRRGQFDLPRESGSAPDGPELPPGRLLLHHALGGERACGGAVVGVAAEDSVLVGEQHCLQTGVLEQRGTYQVVLLPDARQVQQPRVHHHHCAHRRLLPADPALQERAHKRTHRPGHTTRVPEHDHVQHDVRG